MKKQSPQEQVLHEVVNNVFMLVDAQQLACVVRKSRDWVLAAKHAGAPFPGGVTRPEWFLEWLKGSGFSFKEHDRHSRPRPKK